LKNNGVVLSKLDSSQPWFIGNDAEQRLIAKRERVGKPLREWGVNIYYGIKTGLNEAFIIDEVKRQEILNNCQDEDERHRTEAIIKPILRGRDIKRYYYEWAGLWLIAIRAGWTNENRGKEKPNIFIERIFPSLMKHLKNYEKKARIRDDQGDYWWEMRPCAYYDEFEKEKLAWSDISAQPIFTILPKGIYFNNTVYMIASDHNKYFNSIFNSKITRWYFPKISTDLGKEGQRFFKIFVEIMPLPPISSFNKAIITKVEGLVDNILEAKKQNPQADTRDLEQEIDNLVYKLYGLTEEEIKIIENSAKKSD